MGRIPKSFDPRPYICRKLKEMRETNCPVWLTMDSRRLKIAPLSFDEDENYSHVTEYVFKNRGCYECGPLADHDGTIIDLSFMGERRRIIKYKQILAVVLEAHPTKPKGVPS